MGDIKIYDIKSVIGPDKFNIDYFVETGTLYGDAVEYMRQFNLKRYISFEIIKETHEKAAERFKDVENVDIILGDSSLLIDEVISGLDGNIIFWLDAHFPGADIGIKQYGDEMNEDTQLPLQREIEAIQKRVGIYNDIIIVDDLWIYEDGKYEWGTFNDHMRKHGHSITKEQLSCGDASFIRKAFKDTHNIKTINNFQGSLVITPKQEKVRE